MHGFDRNEAGKLFVGGLSWDTTKDSLLEYFTQYGEVIDCVVMKNPETGKSRGFGFVTYRDTSCVDTVLSVPAHIVDGRQVDPKACNPKGTNRGGEGRPGQMGGERMNRGPRGGGGGGPHGDRKIFLGGLPNGVDEEAIRNFFSQYGKVLDVTVMYDAQKQRSRGFGFLTFESDDAVNQVCREHFVNFNGKKVECKRATPRNQGNQGNDEPPPHQMHMPHPGGMPPHMEMGMQPPQHAPGPMPGPEPQWTSPEGWNPHVQQSPPPPPQVGVPPQFQQATVQFQPGYQGEVPAGAPPGWPQQPPPQGAGGWPPGAPPPQQPGVAPGSAQFIPQQPSATGQGNPGAPVYQYAAAPSAQQPPQANGQGLPQVAAVGQAAPAPSSYGYTATSYASPSVALPQNAASLTARQYQDFAGSQQVQIATTMAPLQGTPAPSSTAVSYSAYPSPYGAPLPAGAAPSVPATDPYAQAALAHPQGAVQVAAPAVAPPAGQPTGMPAGYGSPLAQSPAGSGDPAAPKPVDYSSYYSAYGYAVETSPNAAYGAQPAPAQAPAPGQAPYASQDVPQAVAYGGAPAPSPTFQRQGSGQQYHPYARR